MSTSLNKSTITIEVGLDDKKIPSQIQWQASHTEAENMQDARAFLLSFWDAEQRTALSLNLHTNKMMIDEMNDFMFQTLMTLADTYNRATRNSDLSDELKAFAREMYKKAQNKLNTPQQN